MFKKLLRKRVINTGVVAENCGILSAMVEIKRYAPQHPVLKRLVERLQERATLTEKFLALESELLALLDIGLIADARMESLLGEFAAPETVRIDAFCDRHGIHRRTFERLANRIIGTNPMTYLKLNRFRRSLQALLDGGYDSLTEVAHACGYYDQMHFIREFRRFTGSAPSLFLAEKKTVRQISFFS